MTLQVEQALFQPGPWWNLRWVCLIQDNQSSPLSDCQTSALPISLKHTLISTANFLLWSCCNQPLCVWLGGFSQVSRGGLFLNKADFSLHQVMYAAEAGMLKMYMFSFPNYFILTFKLDCWQHYSALYASTVWLDIHTQRERKKDIKSEREIVQMEICRTLVHLPSHAPGLKEPEVPMLNKHNKFSTGGRGGVYEQEWGTSARLDT